MRLEGGRGSWRGALTAIVIAGFLGGCSTVVVSGPTQTQGPAPEALALSEAAANVGRVPWPDYTDMTMSARLIGVAAVERDEPTRDDAVALYLAQLAVDADPVARLAADARAQLAAADVLADVGQKIAAQETAGMAHVATIEDAIVSLRRARETYLLCADRIIADEREARAMKAALKEDFNAAMRRAGATADMLADQAMSGSPGPVRAVVTRSDFAL